MIAFIKFVPIILPFLYKINSENYRQFIVYSMKNAKIKIKIN